MTRRWEEARRGVNYRGYRDPRSQEAGCSCRGSWKEAFPGCVNPDAQKQRTGLAGGKHKPFPKEVTGLGCGCSHDPPS